MDSKRERDDNFKWKKSKSSNNKGKGGNRGANRNARTQVETMVEEKSRSNPASWYDHYPEYTRSAGTIPFSLPLGMQYRLTPTGTSTVDGETAYIPGILGINFIPTPGYSNNNDSPINRAAARYYTYMRGAQKAAANYDSQDVLIAFLALDSCYMYHSLLRRIYGVYNSYTPVNEYYARSLLVAHHVDPDDLKKNGARLREYINSFAIALGSFTAPRSLDFIARHRWMCEGLYLDSQSTRAQTYMFMPDGFWRYDNTVETGSRLNFVGFPGQGTYMTVDDLITFGENLYDNVLADEDIGQISGDYFNAFGASECIQLTETMEGYRIAPIYDPVVLSQIENATIIDGIDYNSLVIEQDPGVNKGAIMFQPKASVTVDYKAFLAEKRMLNFHGDQPDPLQVIEMTKLTVATASDAAPDGTLPAIPSEYNLTCFGSEIAVGAWIIAQPYDTYTGSDEGFKIRIYSAKNISTGATRSDIVDPLREVAALTAFDWAPAMTLYYAVNEPENDPIRCGTILDYDSITVVEDSKLATIHNATMNSLLYLPQMGFTN